MGDAGFKLIPVIDLMEGQVVRGVGGQRHLYRPIESKLLRGSRPLDVVMALRDLFSFQHIYIADLDAIQRVGGHRAVVEALSARFPELELWVDAGIDSQADGQRLLALSGAVCVLGSESQKNTSVLEALRHHPRLVLSLDRKGEARLDPAGIFDRPALWPDRLIAMSLNKVGSEAGPDLPLIRHLRGVAPRVQVYAAGGVRHAQDLEQLTAAGAAGVLLSSALHSGHLSKADLARFR